MTRLPSDSLHEPSANADRRARLREFQEQLAQRIQHARVGDAATTGQLGLLIGTRHWLLDLPSAGEVVAAHDIVSVPLTRAWYRGLINVRGNLFGVIDLACLEGGTPIVPDKDSRIVLFANGFGVNCALLVSRVLGLRQKQSMQPCLDADMVHPWEGECFTEVDTKENASVWMELDLAALIRHPEFLQIGR